MMLIQVVFVTFSDVVSTFLMFARFGGIGEWSMERILLIYFTAVTSFGLAECLCRGFDSFPFGMVRRGGFDRLLLRPRSLTLQTAASVFHLHRLPRPICGISVMILLLCRLHVPMNFSRILMLAAALAGGLLMYMGIFILTSGLSFFTIQGIDWIYIFTNAGYQVTRCPVEYMPKALYRIFTFIIPVLVISYYPMSAICGWGEPVWKGWLPLPAGAGFLLLSWFVWRFGVRHYKSTGS